MIWLVIAAALLVLSQLAFAYALYKLAQSQRYLTRISDIHETRLELHARQMPTLSSPTRAREIFEELDRLREVTKKRTMN